MPISSETPNRSWTETIQNIGKKRALVELWTSVIGTKALEKHAAEHSRNRDAMGRATRRQVYNDAGDAEAEEVGHTILGDIIAPATPQPQQKGLGVLGTLALGALGASIPAAAVGGYILSQVLNKPDTTDTAPTDDQSLDIGLGRLE